MTDWSARQLIGTCGWLYLDRCWAGLHCEAGYVWRTTATHSNTWRYSDLAAYCQCGEFYAVRENDGKLTIWNSVTLNWAMKKTFGTTNFIRHLKCHQHAEYAKFQEASNRTAATATVSQSTQPGSLLLPLQWKNKATTRKIMEFMTSLPAVWLHRLNREPEHIFQLWDHQNRQKSVSAG